MCGGWKAWEGRGGRQPVVALSTPLLGHKGGDSACDHSVWAAVPLPARCPMQAEESDAFEALRETEGARLKREKRVLEKQVGWVRVRGRVPPHPT